MNGDFCDHLGCLQWIFLFKLPSDFGFFQERAPILEESVKTSTAIDVGLISAIWEQKVYFSNCQVLTGIGTTRLPPVAHCSLFAVNPLFLIDFCLQFNVAYC